MQKVLGNVSGIDKFSLSRLEELSGIKMEPQIFISNEILEVMRDITSKYNREICVYISRQGEIVDVMVGSSDWAKLGNVHLRRNKNRLSCIRCIHTHPNGVGLLSDLDISALINMKFDAITAIGVINNELTNSQSAFLDSSNINQVKIMQPVSVLNLPNEQLLKEIDIAEENYQYEVSNIDETERVLLVGIEDEKSLDELEKLTNTADAIVIERVLQKRPKPDSSTYVGIGKVRDIAQMVQINNIDTVICDDELSGSVQKNIEELLGVRVIDRTMLILDIFAKHAKTREGKLQVEAAQLKYRQSHLIGQGIMMSRIAGGIGTKGPGETKLETDKRLIKNRIYLLNKELEKLSAQRDIQRKERISSKKPIVALVGYTNAGKSSLINALTDSDAFVMDKLFATLDSLTRKTTLNDGTEVLVVDTVGFIRKLPHFMVKAFHSTLEEANIADIVIEVIDGSDSNNLQYHEVVNNVLAEIGAEEKPRIEVLNKCDREGFSSENFPEAISISTKTGEGLKELKEIITKKLSNRYKTLVMHVDFKNYSKVSKIREIGTVISEKYLEKGVEVTANIPSGYLDYYMNSEDFSIESIK